MLQKVEQKPQEPEQSSLVVHVFKLMSLGPLLMHNPSGMRSEAKAKGAVVKSIPAPAEEAEAAAYRLPNGNLFLPSDMFRQSLLEGCIGRKIGKMGAARVIGAAVMPMETEIPLLDPDTEEPLKDYEIDIRRCVIQKMGIRRARPIIRKWLAKVVFEVDLEFVQIKFVEDLFSIAGRVAGVADYRVNKGGIFGRYKVLKG